jgi:hypothetical protein
MIAANLLVKERATFEGNSAILGTVKKENGCPPQHANFFFRKGSGTSFGAKSCYCRNDLGRAQPMDGEP